LKVFTPPLSFILTGPTGTGKTSVAIQIASRLDLAILSIDSMMVYRGLNIGTAKPSMDEMQRVPHHLINIVDPVEDFDVARFLNQAEAVGRSESKALIGVGGTPFYIRALMEGVTGINSLPDIELRLEQYSSEELYRWLWRLDRPRAETLHPNDRFRTIRALSIIFSTGKKASLHKPKPMMESDGLVKLVALRTPRARMHILLQKRIERMFKAGLLQEVEGLRHKPLSKTAANAVGYKELLAYFRGECSLAVAKEKILVATRRLFKHQMTWLQKMPVVWVDIDPEAPQAGLDKCYGIAAEHFRKQVKR